MERPQAEARRTRPFFRRLEGLPFSVELLVWTLAGVVLALVKWWPMVRSYPATPQYDGRYFLYQIEASKAAYTHYRELSLWNPYDCRGIPMWDLPEAIVISPLGLATIGLGALATLYIWNLAHAAAGFVGMVLLARRDLGLSRLGTGVAASFWALGAWHACQSAGNHETFVSFFLLPLAVFFWRRAETHPPAIVAAGATLALMVYDGGTYALPYTAIVLVIETSTRLHPLSRAVGVCRRAAAVGVTAVGLAAARLLPLHDQLTRHHRIIPPDTDHLLRWSTLKTVFFYHDADPLGIGLADQQYGLDEYVIYVGYSGFALALLGAVLASRVPTLRWTLWTGGAAFVLGLGRFAWWAPWALLHDHVFPFTAMRVASRFLLVLAFLMTLWSGYAVDAFPKWIETKRAGAGRIGLALVIALSAFAVGGTAAWGRAVIAHRFLGPPPAVVSASPRFYYGGDGLTPDWLDQPRQNRAHLYCRSLSFIFHHDAVVWQGDVPQARASDDRATVRDVHRTNNTFDLDVDVRAPARILLNSAYDRGWQSDVGTPLEVEHMLAIDLPPGSYRVHLRYWPRTLTGSLVVTTVFSLASLVFLGWHLRRSRAPA